MMYPLYILLQITVVVPSILLFIQITLAYNLQFSKLIYASYTDCTVLQMMLQVIWPVYITSKVNWTWQFYTINKLLHVTPDFWKPTIIWLVFFLSMFSLKNLGFGFGIFFVFIFNYKIATSFFVFKVVSGKINLVIIFSIFHTKF